MKMMTTKNDKIQIGRVLQTISNFSKLEIFFSNGHFFSLTQLQVSKKMNSKLFFAI